MTNIHFVYLCFFSSVLVISLVASEDIFRNLRSRPKYAGVHHIHSADMRETDIAFLKRNECKFYIVEKTIFYACPKRPTRYPPRMRQEVFHDKDDQDDRDDVYYGKSEKFECPFSFGTYPHPTDCRKYFLCIFDKPRTMTCDSSKLYDEYDGECAEKSTVDCGDRTGGGTKGTSQTSRYTTEAAKITTKKGNEEKFKCPYTWGNFPNPKDCSQYYLCLRNRPSLKKCKPSELYDTKKEKCRDEDKVDCGSRFNPREKTTTLPKTTVAPTVRTRATTANDIISSTRQDSTSPPPSEATSDQDATDFSTVGEVSSSSEPRTTIAEDVRSTTGGDIVSEQTARPTGEPRITDDSTSDTDEPKLTSEEGSEETGTSNQPTADDSSVSQEPGVTDEENSTSEKSETTNGDSDTSRKPGSTTESEISSTEPQPTEDVSTASEEDLNSVSTGSGITTETEKSSDEYESQTPAEETTSSGGLQSSSGDITNVDQKSSDEEKTPTTNLRSTTETASEGASSTSGVSVSKSEDLTPSEETELTSPAAVTSAKDDTSTEERPSSLPESSVDEETSSLTSTEAKITSEKTQSISDYSTPSMKPENTDEDSNTSSQPTTTAEDETSSREAQSTPDDSSTSDITRDEPQSTAEEITSTREQHSTADDSTTSEYPASTDENSNTSSQPITTAEDEISSREAQSTSDDSSISDKTDQPQSTTEDVIPTGEKRSTAEDSTHPENPETTTDPRTSSEQIKTSPDQVTLSEEQTTEENSQKDQSTSGDYNTETSSSNTATETTSSKSPKSFLCPKKKGNFPHEDCSSYYECREGDFTIVNCPEGTLFDLTYTDCNNEDDVDCGNRKRPDEVIGDSECLNRRGRVPHSHYCDMYFECGENGKSTLVKCNDRQYYDTGREECLDWWLVICDDRVDSKDKHSTTSSLPTIHSSEGITTEGTSDTADSSIDDTEKTVGYTSHEIPETTISSDYNTKKTDKTSDFGNVDLTSTLSTVAFETSKNPGTKSTASRSTLNYTDSQELIVSTVDHMTNTTEMTSTTYVTEDVSETHSTVNSTKTSSTTYVNEISTESTINHSTDTPSTHDATNDGASEHVEISTTEEIMDKSSQSTVPTKSERESLIPKITDSYSSTQSDSDKDSGITEEHSTKNVTSTTTVVYTTWSPNEITVTSVKPTEICADDDYTCIIDDKGNAFRCPKSHGHFPHPDDVSKFLHCDNFRIHVIACPDGLRFDHNYKICTWAAEAQE